MLYLVIFFSSLIITIFTTPYWIEYLEVCNVVDRPSGERRIHTVPTPRMGGLIIYVIAIVSLIAYERDSNQVKLIVVGSLIMALVGIIDDLRTLRWKTKFAIQTVSVLNLVYLLHPYFIRMSFFSIIIPFPFDYIILFFFILGTVNSINLMDGMDGLVGGFSLLVCAVIFILSALSHNHVLLVLSASLLGGLLGFLKYNASPAKIFLGDTGSLTLGYFLVVLTLFTSIEQYQRTLDISFATMMLAVPIIDTLKVMFVRLYNGNSMFLPDKKHLHHIVLGVLDKSKTTVFLILVLSLLFITDSLIYLRYSKIMGFIFFICLTGCLLLMKTLINTSKYFLRLEVLKQNYFNISQKTLLRIKNILIYFSGIISIVLLAGLFPYSASMSKNVLLTLMGIVIALMLLSFFNYPKTKVYSDIYVFLNLVIFLTISYLSDTVFASHFFGDEQKHYFFIITMITFLSLVVFLIICKNCFPAGKKSFLTGLDLILIALISLIFILHQFYNYQGYVNLGVNGFYILILYIWYKIISGVDETYHKFLFHTSFLIPFFAMIYIFLS